MYFCINSLGMLCSKEALRLNIEYIPRVQLQLEAHYRLQATCNQLHQYFNLLVLSQNYQ